MLASTICSLLNTDRGKRLRAKDEEATWWILRHSPHHLQVELPRRCLRSPEVPWNWHQVLGSEPQWMVRVPTTHCHLVTLVTNITHWPTGPNLLNSLSWVMGFYHPNQLTQPAHERAPTYALGGQMVQKTQIRLLELILMFSPQCKPYGRGFPSWLTWRTGHLRLINNLPYAKEERDGEGLTLVWLDHENKCHGGGGKTCVTFLQNKTFLF